MVSNNVVGNNPTRNPFRRARLGLDDQQAVDEYKARSVWPAWWALDEALRRRYFTRDERAFITRYGGRLDELASYRDGPRNEKEEHFLRVCGGEAEPDSPRERLWLLVQLVCRFQRAVDRAARADLAEHDAFALRAENAALKAKIDHLERYALRLQRERGAAAAENPSVCNVVWATGLFAPREKVLGPPPVRFILSAARRGLPALTLPYGTMSL